MIAILQWTTLAVCALVAIARIPSALRGENRSIFGVFVLSTLAILLSIDVSYLAIDSWLGSENYTNLILRFVVYGTVLLAGYRIAKAFDAQTSIRLIIGPAGLGVLTVIGIATLGLFLAADTTGSVTGLTDPSREKPRECGTHRMVRGGGPAVPVVRRRLHPARHIPGDPPAATLCHPHRGIAADGRFRRHGLRLLLPPAPERSRVSESRHQLHRSLVSCPGAGLRLDLEPDGEKAGFR